MSTYLTTRVFFNKVMFVRLLNTVKFPLLTFSKRSEVIQECEEMVDYSSFIQKFCHEYGNNLLTCLSKDRKLISGNNIQPDEVFTSFINSKKFQNYKNDSVIVLLVSKLLNELQLNVPKLTIEHKQNVLADVTIATQIAVTTHKNINNLLANEPYTNNDKLFLLIGDYLFSEINLKLVKMRRSDIYYIMISALRDMISVNFVGGNEYFPGPPKYDNENEVIDFNIISPIPKDEDFLGHPKKEWVARKLYKGPILLGRSCQGSALAANLNDLSDKAFYFGCYLGLAWQAANELEDFFNSNIFSLTSAPVLFGINENPDIYKMIIKEGKEDVKHIDYLKLKGSIFNTEAIVKTKSLLNECTLKATDFFKAMSGGNEDNKYASILKRLVHSY